MNRSFWATIILSINFFILWGGSNNSNSKLKLNTEGNNRNVGIRRCRKMKRNFNYISSGEKEINLLYKCVYRKKIYNLDINLHIEENKKYIKKNHTFKSVVTLLARGRKNGIETQRESNIQNDFETFLIIDGSSILFKNFFGMPHLKNDNEINLSTIYGFIQSLNKMYNLFSPSYILIVFDSKTSNDEKKKIYAKYKLMRKKNPDELYEQLKLVSDFCDLIGIKTITATDVESDNYIAGVVDSISNTIMMGESVSHRVFQNGEGEGDEENRSRKEFRVIIVSSDKDLLQLLEYNNDEHNNMNISICQPNKKYRLVDANAFFQEYNLLPSQYSDYLIMVGDKTDGISGIPNIGDKISKHLLKEFYSIDNILRNLHKIPTRLHAIFLNNIENINTFRKLIKLKCETKQPIVLNDYRQGSIKDFNRFQNIVDKYSLHKLIKKTVIVNYK
ncbi:5'-3' exonuclease, N-terminal resolvase-like domain [Plasmodium gonderi]|uniref:5'-3' exonuclease, N-terminal resolvase-like domain n=1 Tax=Plasmodium gonderi TaxID=77519 RepID=A0A1Y1JAL9_PLAGO|nr:5'-3' exonuclease, N-terminal resolvase-like domain [Plasmodium gonderi]GAW79571.1 5'-3' exonuclease, N-terminal resolvase-like domain [Plasmodium gonderi]